MAAKTNSATSWLTPLLASVALAMSALSLALIALPSTPNASEKDVAGKVPSSHQPQKSATDPIVAEAPQLESHAAPVTVRLPIVAAPATKEQLETEAAFVAKQLVELLPGKAFPLHVQAMLYAQLHQTAKAETLWKQCIQLDPTAEPYYVNLAAIAIDRGNSRLAVDTLRQAIERGIQSTNVNHHLGVALNAIGESEEAIQVARRGLQKDPDAGGLWLILGQAQLQLGANEEAEKSLLRAVELGVQSKTSYFSLFNVSMRLGKREDAQRYRERYASFQDKELNAEQRYKILSEAEARRVCISVLAESAALYLAIPDRRTAEHLLLRILALEPKNRPALLDLATIYTQSNQLANQILVRRRLTDVDSKNLLNYLHLAKAYVAAHKPAAAEAQLKLAISLSPQMVTGYAAMADFLLEQNQPAIAQWYVEQAIRIKPNKQGFQLLAKTLSAQGKEQEARTALEIGTQQSDMEARDEP